MINESLILISIGFSLGLVHALDADHVMAVSALSNSRPGFMKTIRFCLHWALGHGGVLMASGLLLFGLGIGIPESMIWLSEMFVGLFLIAMGIICFYRFRTEKITIAEHSHGEVVHRHWHVENQKHANSGHVDQRQTAKAHTPVFVGVLHGLAGSAPALALVPVVAQGELIFALFYLLLFSLGVMLSMVCFGLGFGATQRFLERKYLWIFGVFRHLIAMTSVVVGSYWLTQAF